MSIAKTCTFKGCENKHRCKGYCIMHYNRARKGWPMDAPYKKKILVSKCSLPTCDKEYDKGGYCTAHYKKAKKYGNPLHQVYEMHGLMRQHIVEYRTWSNMRRRCSDPKVKNYFRYGGRGIRVSDRWLHSFKNFYEDMGPRPEGHSLDRINVNGNYEPGNVRWATSTQQANNTRSNKNIEIDGKTMTLSEWCRHYGVVEMKVVSKRLIKGWNVKEALTTPLQKNQFSSVS